LFLIFLLVLIEGGDKFTFGVLKQIWYDLYDVLLERF
jgi:hypothetical protein